MKILMVCLGNICRSPLAEGIMRHHINLHHLNWEVDSCGTSAWHIGERPHHGSIEIAKSHGVDMSNMFSRQFVISDFDDFDLIIAMDEQNKRDILNLSRSKEDEIKVKLLLAYDPNAQSIDVPDPYYVGGFDIVYDMIAHASDELLNKLIPQS